jgi:uncharacterized membrane protein YidH (DUF202 family)
MRAWGFGSGTANHLGWPGACSRAPPEVDVKLIGMILVIFGIVALALGGITYTKREKVLDIGPITATTEKHKTIPLSPIVGIASLAGGIALIVAGSRTRV